MPGFAAAGAEDVSTGPLFGGTATLPVPALRGANSDALGAATVAEMAAGDPDVAGATVPDRGHAPFLAEPEAVSALDRFVARTLP
ncbi:MAG: hypothetical protein AAFW69_02480 [Pseudomonadota bacterium]